MRNVRVIHWGFGAMGSGIARVLCQRQGVEVVGACDVRPHLAGKSMWDVLGLARGERADVRIESDIRRVLQPGAGDICVIATDSFVRDVYEKIVFALQQKTNVLTIAEEMSWPWAQSPELAQQMDRLARQQGVSVLGTGINPGLMMDVLAVCLSGCMTQVDRVTCKRVNSLSPFGEAVMKEQGIGITLDEFEQGKQDGTLAGHVGFAESVAMIAQALGLKLDEFRQQMLPIVTEVDRTSPHGFAAAGHVAGVNMTGQGLKAGQVRVDMHHPQQIEPQLAGVDTGDYITLEGQPPVHMEIKPEVEGGTGTIAMAANMLPFVVAARPGLLTMLDLPVPRCVMGDYRDIAFAGRQP